VQQAQALIDGKYQLVRCLGEGGMGAVYEGRHLGTGRRVAVKLVSTEALAKGPDVADRFRREAMASGAIESQYIAHVLDTGVDSRTASPYLVMELLVGEDLQRAIKRVRRFTPDLALRIAAQACMGLQKAHEAGVVHRDVKPANLFLAVRDHELVVKLLDFGIAKVRLDPITSPETDKTRSGMMLGSPLYMSPEQARGKKTIDHRSDVFSLGVVLYEMLAGKTPHAKSETIGDLIVRICGEPARPLQEVAPSVNQATAAIVHKAIALDPGDRFVSAEAMLAAIRAIVPGGFGLEASLLPALAETGRQAAPSAPSGVRAAQPSRPNIAPTTGERSAKGTAPPPPRALVDSGATIANTPTSKSDSKSREISTGSGNRAALVTDKSPMAKPAPAPAPKAPAPKAAPDKVPMQKRFIVPALKKAAVMLWGDDGLNDIAAALENDARSEFFRAAAVDEWIECRHVIEWCLRTFEGPCRRDRNKMAEYLDRAYDLSYGVIRKFVVRLADPASIVPRLPGFWKQDFNSGELEATLDPPVDGAHRGCTIRIWGNPYVNLVHTRAGQAEIYRYGFSQSRSKDVTESHNLEKGKGPKGEDVLVIRLKWK
jgi:serine/threonine-protein kinase